MKLTKYRYRLESLADPVSFAKDMVFIQSHVLAANNGKANIIYSFVKNLCNAFNRDLELSILGTDEENNLRVTYGMGNVIKVPKDVLHAVFYEVKSIDLDHARLAII